MSGKSQRSLIGWMAVVTVPLLILAILATLGFRAEKLRARSKLREEAEAISVSQARLLSGPLNAAIQEFPKFSPTPLPGRPSTLDEALDSPDISTLMEVRDNPDAGFSPSGLPRRALAALRIEYLEPGRQDPGKLVSLLTEEAPSILTLPALKRLKSRDPDFEIPVVWQLINQLEELLSDKPDGGWIRFQEEPWWISADGDRYLSPGALDLDGIKLPSFATARFSSNLSPLTGPGEGEVLASTPIDFPSPLALDWILASPETLDEIVRSESRGVLVLLTISLVVSVFGLLAIMRMIREERRLGSLKSQFVASVSHELRAPIGTIRLMADALQAGRAETPGEFHRLISRESERLSHLIENVLDFARIEEGRRHYHFEGCDLAAAIEETAEPYRASAAETGHTIELDLERGRASIDRGAIQQAIANLLDNALKFSGSGTTITVSLQWSESAWNLKVMDEGPGVPEAERDRIFERFYRLGDEMRRETKGTGIGLSLVRHIIQAHGGSVSVSNHPTTFTLSAPIKIPISS